MTDTIERERLAKLGRIAYANGSWHSALHYYRQAADLATNETQRMAYDFKIDRCKTNIVMPANAGRITGTNDKRKKINK
jgi:hypothetical protein